MDDKPNRPRDCVHPVPVSWRCATFDRLDAGEKAEQAIQGPPNPTPYQRMLLTYLRSLTRYARDKIRRSIN